MEVFYEGVVAGNSANVDTDDTVSEFIAAPGAEFQVFELGDAARTTPLPVKVGGRTTTTIRTSDRSVMPDVRVTSDNYAHIFKSGTFEWERLSNDGMKKAVDEARTAAQVAALTAGTDAVAVVEEKLAAGAFKGEPGKDGSNVVPTAQAIAAEIQTPGTPANAALSATFAEQIALPGSPTNLALQARGVYNIRDFGVEPDTEESQTAKIKAAFDSKPGEAFYFGRGRFMMKEPLVYTQQNSVHLDGELFCGAPMNDFITFAPDLLSYQYARGKFFVGRGTINANLMAKRALVINQLIGFELGNGLHIKDAINRFVVTGPIGAQMLVHNLDLENTTDTNVADNVGIEANMGDCVFHDVFARDVTIFARDYKANLWDNCHPWIGPNWSGGQQMTLRYPSSVGIETYGPSTLRGWIGDTFRTQIRPKSNGTAYTERPNLLDCRFTWADTVVPPAIAAANPAVIFDNTAGVGFVNDRARVSGLTSAPIKFIDGPTTNVDSRNNKNQGYIIGAQGTTSDSLDYRNGVQEGSFVFTPTIIGSNSAGTHTYTSRTGRMVVNRDSVTYHIRIVATLDSTTAFAGSLQISGLPLPYGATRLRDAGAAMGYSVNVNAHSGVIFAGTTPVISLMSLGTSGTTAIDIPGQALRGKSVDLMISITDTYIKD